MSGEATVLLVGLLVAHYLGDFTPLSTPRMRDAKANGGPLRSIAGHAAVHAALIAVPIVAFARPTAWLLAAAVALEFGTHFGIDAARARLGRGRPSLADPGGNVFWYLLGVDQLAHTSVLVGLAALALSAG